MERIDRVLKKRENYLKLDLWYYIKNSSFLLSAEVISMIFSLLLSIALARLLTKDLYGQWSYIFSVVGFLIIFNLPGINTAISQAVAKGYDNVLIDGTKEKMRWGIIGALLVFGIGIYYFFNGQTLLGKCFMIFSLIFPFYETFQTYVSFLTGKKRFDKYAKYSVIIQAISVSVTILIIYYTRNLVIILITYITLLSVLRFVFFNLSKRLVENDESDEELISFGRHLTLQNVPGNITSWGDQILIGIFLSFPELAVYSVAKGFFSMVKVPMIYTANLSLPKLSQMNETDAFYAVKKRFFYFFLFNLSMGVVAILLCPYVIQFFYTQNYIDSVFYAQLLIVALIFGSTTTIIGWSLFPSQKKIKELYKFHIFNMIVEISFMFLLIFKFGILGVVFSKIISNACTMIYSLRLAKWL